jgi:tRNA(adenine34) deaminase
MPAPLSAEAVMDAIHRALAARTESGKGGNAASVLCDGPTVAT